jgi:hypothetical protein
MHHWRLLGAGSRDSAAEREQHFDECLSLLAGWLQQQRNQGQLPNGIAFPYLIGCGLAGGHWPTYQSKLQVGPLG